MACCGEAGAVQLNFVGMHGSLRLKHMHGGAHDMQD